MSAARTTGPKAPVLHLVPRRAERRAPEVNRETVRCLVQLLELATKGEVIGLAFAAQKPGRVYFTDVVGDTQDSPTFARGMIRALDDELAKRVGACE
jgi:hypothetical protein